MSAGKTVFSSVGGEDESIDQSATKCRGKARVFRRGHFGRGEEVAENKEIVEATTCFLGN